MKIELALEGRFVRVSYSCGCRTDHNGNKVRLSRAGAIVALRKDIEQFGFDVMWADEEGRVLLAEARERRMP